MTTQSYQDGRNSSRSAETWEFELTDVGNARRLRTRHGQNLRYVPEWKRWLVWDGTRWSSDNRAQGQVERWAVGTAEAIAYDESKRARDADKQERLKKWSSSSQNRARVVAMMDSAKAGPGMAVSPSELDADPWLLPCANGTLELGPDGTPRLREHRREDMLTKLVPVDYDADATAPTWTAFLERVLPDPELRAFAQRVAGYTLTGSVREQKLFLLYGTGANGKSVFLDALGRVLGDYAATASSGTILNRRDGQHTEDLARLAGARLVTSIEVEAEKRMTEALVKSVTGGDAITARFMRGNSFEFVPQFKLWLAVNHLPVVGSGDHGIWRRLVPVPFTVQIAEAEQNLNLTQELREEAEGILAWAVRGTKDYLERGLDEPASVTEAALTYRETMDDMGRFLDEATEKDPEGFVALSDLYAAAGMWWEAEGLRLPPKPVFGRQLTERGVKDASPRVDGKRVRGRTGFRLVGDYAARAHYLS